MFGQNILGKRVQVFSQVKEIVGLTIIDNFK